MDDGTDDGTGGQMTDDDDGTDDETDGQKTTTVTTGRTRRDGRMDRGTRWTRRDGWTDGRSLSLSLSLSVYVSLSLFLFIYIYMYIIEILLSGR